MCLQKVTITEFDIENFRISAVGYAWQFH